MKRLTAIVVALLFILGVASVGLAAEKAEKAPAKAEKAEKAELKCTKCHKGDKTLDKIIEKKKIKTAAELMKTLKEGPKAKLHAGAKVNDDDIKAAAKELKLSEK